ncbi:MAG: hypothetical protein IPJ46_18500 [Anaerolineales bacterium]|nr:hypothetical protein [Anaerolineales bacterium]
MSKKLFQSITVMFIAFVLFFTTTSHAFASGNSKSEGEVEGSISAVSSASLTITPKKGGANLTVTVDAATRIKRNGKTVLLADLQTGDKVNVKYDKKSFLAMKVDAKAKTTSGNSNSSSKGEVKGGIASVGSGSLTITPKNGGAPITVTIDGTTRVKRNGKTVSAADLQAGDKVEVKYNKMTMLASKIEAKGVKTDGNSNTNSNNNSSDDNSNSNSSNGNTNANSNSVP